MKVKFVFSNFEVKEFNINEIRSLSVDRVAILNTGQSDTTIKNPDRFEKESFSTTELQPTTFATTSVVFNDLSLNETNDTIKNKNQSEIWENQFDSASISNQTVPTENYSSITLTAISTTPTVTMVVKTTTPAAFTSSEKLSTISLKTSSTTLEPSSYSTFSALPSLVKKNQTELDIAFTKLKIGLNTGRLDLNTSDSTSTQPTFYTSTLPAPSFGSLIEINSELVALSKLFSIIFS
jgi:hypothetical protein